jgi:hypothetical protein
VSKFIIVRENDDMRWESDSVKYIRWDENGRGSDIVDEIELDSSLVIDYIRGNVYGWLTTQVTEILERTTNNYFKIVRFRTKNSTYKVLEKYESNNI